MLPAPHPRSLSVRRCQSHGLGYAQGWTLVELFVAIAVLSVLVVIAIPSYNNYVREGHFASMRATINGMRTSIEDFRLENGNYGGLTTHNGIAAIQTQFDYTPSGDTSAYTYGLTVTSTNSYDVYGSFGSDIWVRCDNRYVNCCDSETPGASGVTSACP